MDLVLVGLSHKTAPVEVREQIAFPEEHLPGALRLLRTECNLQEGMIVSTCNRVEIIAQSNRGQNQAVESIKNFLYVYHSLNRPFLEHYLYSYLKHDAVRHVFRVAASLDSMVVGEPQIMAQMKRAYDLAREVGNVGSSLNQLFPRAFFVAKRVRTSTLIGTSAVSISSVAVELARKIFGNFEKKSILLLGAGKMGQLAARNLILSGISEILVANRSQTKARQLAARFRGECVPFDDLTKSLIRSDIVLASTGSDSFILDKKLIEPIIRKRKYRPLFVIDISVPRNVDPEVNQIENVFLYDIDDLQSVIEANRRERHQEAEVAEGIVEQEVTKFQRRLETQSLGLLIGTLRERIEDICLKELQSQRGKISDKDYQKLEQLLRKAARKIAHPLIAEIKRDGTQTSRRYHTIELVKKMFRLDNEE